jgi:hypothetical protein
VAFFRRSDAVLLAGDAVTTMNFDSFFLHRHSAQTGVPPTCTRHL